MTLYDAEYPVHEYIIERLPISEPDLARLPRKFQQWARETYPYDDGMNPPRPQTNGETPTTGKSDA